MKRVLIAMGLAGSLFTAGALGAGAAKYKDPGTGSCVAAGTVVTGSGLPTDQLVNFLIIDSTGTTGFVVGYPADGTITETVPAPTQPTTYEFTSRISGGDFQHNYTATVFASCSQ